MTVGTTTALGIIKSALRKINSYQSGEQLADYGQGIHLWVGREHPVMDRAAALIQGRQSDQ
jgi:hypothetical protein